MTQRETPARYGVTEQTVPGTDVERACEQIRHLGYGTIDGGYAQTWLTSLSAAFDRTRERYQSEYGGGEQLRAIDEHNTIRLPLAKEPMFLELATNSKVLEICSRLISGYTILNQQNGIINPPRAARYDQGAWHRDLPYQHVVFSRPMAINALFCLDAFTAENGATMVLPATHKQEEFPSDRFVEASAVQVCAPHASG